MFDQHEQARVAHCSEGSTAGKCPSGHAVAAGLGRVFLTRSAHRPLPAIFASAVLSISLIAGLRVDAEQKPSDKPPRIDERELPPKVRETYKVFRTKCGKCHSIERVLRAKYDKLEEWQGCIARMAKLRGANISLKDQERVKEFFAYYLKHLRSPEPANEPDAPERDGEKGEKREPKQQEPGA